MKSWDVLSLYCEYVQHYGPQSEKGQAKALFFVFLNQSIFIACLSLIILFEQEKDTSNFQGWKTYLNSN